MTFFNSKLVESLDLLNHILAVIFVGLAIFRFTDIVVDNFVGAILETLTVLGVGVLTCGYIALMININNTLESIKAKLGK
jgi:hypothetical protein